MFTMYKKMKIANDVAIFTKLSLYTLYYHPTTKWCVSCAIWENFGVICAVWSLVCSYVIALQCWSVCLTTFGVILPSQWAAYTGSGQCPGRPCLTVLCGVAVRVMAVLHSTSLDQWQSCQPISVLTLDRADRAVLKVAGKASQMCHSVLLCLLW